MTDKQQIEDIAMELYNNQREIDVTNPYEVAELIYKAGYRKVDENAVVLTQEEEQDLIHEMYEKGKFDIFIELRSTVYENTRKETARELLELIYQSLATCLVHYKDGHYYFEEFDVTYILKTAEKQFGVEIKKPWEVEE